MPSVDTASEPTMAGQPIRVIASAAIIAHPSYPHGVGPPLPDYACADRVREEKPGLCAVRNWTMCGKEFVWTPDVGSGETILRPGAQPRGRLVHAALTRNVYAGCHEMLPE
jgi:hypothetical protein